MEGHRKHIENNGTPIENRRKQKKTYRKQYKTKKNIWKTTETYRQHQKTQSKQNTFLFMINLKEQEEGLVVVSIQMKRSDKKTEKQIPVAIAIIMNTILYKSEVMNKQKMQTSEATTR